MAVESTEASAYSQLQALTVTDVQFTGVDLGRGAYGTVSEVKLAGAFCAAKQIHEELLQASEVDAIVKQFVSECILLNSLHHPNIVQFFGVCSVERNKIPALLMERLTDCLHSKLNTQPNISLYEKHSILLDVSRGLAYLHTRNPPVIHRDLTARNILLTSDGTAKIADLGVARLFDSNIGKQMKTMTNVPGSAPYMPPEAIEVGCKYNASIDVFSFGHLALFTLTQVFPDLLAPTYPHPKKNKVVARTEIERRSTTFNILYDSLGEKHPLVKIVASCLQNQPMSRPSAEDTMKNLEEVSTDEKNSQFYFMTKRDLIQNSISQKETLEKVANELNAQTIHIKSQEEKIAFLKERLHEVEAEKALSESKATAVGIQRSYSLDLHSTMPLPEQIERVVFPVRGLETSPLPSLDQLSLQRPTSSSGELYSISTEATTQQSDIKFPCLINWSKIPPFPSLCSGVKEELVTVGDSVFIRCGKNEVVQFTPARNLWKELPSPDLSKFQMVEVQGQLLVVEDAEYFQTHPNKILLWDESKESWVWRYPALPYARVEYSLVSCNQYLLIIAGNTVIQNPSRKSIDVLDTSALIWYKYDSIPAKSLMLGSKVVAIGDSLVISHFCAVPQMQGTKSCFLVNLPELISHAVNKKWVDKKTAKPWKQLCDLPHYNMTTASVGGTLLAMGGITGRLVTKSNKRIYMYNPEVDKWLEISESPETFSHYFYGTMPSGEILVTSKMNSQNAYSGVLSCSL